MKLVPEWFVTSKMIKKLYTALYDDDGLLFFDEYSGNVTFCCNKTIILSVNLNNINLDNNFDQGDLDTIILIRLLTWHSKFRKRKALKKKIGEELMSRAWHSSRWWNFCMSGDEKKEIEPIFTD